MPTISRTIEGIDLDTRTGLWCDCGNWTRAEVDVAIIDAETLEVLCHRTGSTCLACGSEGD